MPKTGDKLKLEPMSQGPSMKLVPRSHAVSRKKKRETQSEAGSTESKTEGNGQDKAATEHADNQEKERPEANVLRASPARTRKAERSGSMSPAEEFLLRSPGGSVNSESRSNVRSRRIEVRSRKTPENGLSSGDAPEVRLFARYHPRHAFRRSCGLLICTDAWDCIAKSCRKTDSHVIGFLRHGPLPTVLQKCHSVRRGV